MSTNPDRLYIENDRGEFIRGLIKNENEYLQFDQNKDSFLYAMTLGKNFSKEIINRSGFIMENYLKIDDLCIIYSIGFKYISNIDDLNNKELIYSIVEKKANAGYIEMEKDNFFYNSNENYLKKIAELDSLYEDYIREP